MNAPLKWHKSTYSSDSGGNCLEMAFDWHKSSYSDSSGGNCVEAISWRKSMYSSDAGGDCVEVAADWHRSSYSDPGGGNCAEVARRPDRAPVHIQEVHIRDSKNPTGGALTFNQPTWSSFLGHVKAHIPV
ncbi:DUF397 domain-containing protein [Streptomyces rectiverticillatus]|uniref:DUF397 domain-containing protein n=1 Tax=Streptomyces rectiverticillatus TaxID=173860 RepID=UPI0015C3F6A9|nr:DUF397 domain-containing protein [Streptomyces rectiverticillatus]QLE73662.1 DUF397 domain-containing protein [Streptomyces rectiverticillatus]